MESKRCTYILKCAAYKRKKPGVTARGSRPLRTAKHQATTVYKTTTSSVTQ